MKKLALIGTIVLAAVGIVFYEQGVSSSPALASPAIAFKDVPSDYWAKDAIQTAVDKGYVIGKSEGIFDPEASVTRAEFIKMVVTAEKLPVTGETTGKDWYGPYVNAAVQNGIHVWSDFTTGDWNTPLTRAEMARLAVRGTGSNNTDDKKWLYLATKAGLVQGIDNTGTLAEDGTTTRAQSVTIIERILSVKRGETLPADKHAVSRAELLWHKTNIFSVMPEHFANHGNNPDWDESKLTVETPDGQYKATVDAVIAIDLEDPNDPNRGELPQELYWDNGNYKGISVWEYSSSYILYFKSHVDYNYNTHIYAESSHIGVGFYGVVNPDKQARKNGTLNSIAGLSTQSNLHEPGDYFLPAYIIPKKGLQTDGYLSLTIRASAIPPNPDYHHDIYQSIVPKQF